MEGINRYSTPQRRHANSPLTRYRGNKFFREKVTRVVEGHLMPFRDTSSNRKREGFVENESKCLTHRNSQRETDRRRLLES